MEIIGLLTKHDVQIVCQIYARCFTHPPLLTHLKNYTRYIFIVSILHLTGTRVNNVYLSRTFSPFFLLYHLTSTQKRRRIVGSSPGYFK